MTIMQWLLASIVVVFISLPMHEVAHGWMASKLGDPTAKNLGRLNLNPLAHFDPIGTTMILLLGFGWAKPVPVNPYYFKNRKNGMAIVSLAGPGANFVIALVSVLLAKIITNFVPYNNFTGIFANVMLIIAQINISLAAFNLIPIPPLDGSKIIGFFLPMNLYYRLENWYARYQQIFLYAFMAVIFILPRLGSLGNIIYTPLRLIQNGLYYLINFLTGFVDIIGRLV